MALRFKETKAFALVETLYAQDGNIESYDIICAGEITSWQELKDLLYYYYQRTYKDSIQYEIIWNEEPGAYQFAVKDRRLGYVVADVEILITSLAY